MHSAMLCGLKKKRDFFVRPAEEEEGLHCGLLEKKRGYTGVCCGLLQTVVAGAPRCCKTCRVLPHQLLQFSC
jgi:hypothetical protein